MKEDLSWPQGLLIVIIGILLGALIAMVTTTDYYKSRKVKELERGSVFVIDSVPPQLVKGDTVQVNLSSRRVDPGDSTAMLCVIQ